MGLQDPENEPKNAETSTAALPPSTEHPKDEAALTDNTAVSSERDDESQGEKNDEAQYPSGLKVTVLSIGLCLGMFVVALDNTVICKWLCIFPFASESNYRTSLLYSNRHTQNND